MLLPLRFNDGQAVPDELVGRTVKEIRQRFGAISSEAQSIHGIWEHEAKEYRDELARYFVDVPDLPEHREFFLSYKETLKACFQQIDIWITSYPIRCRLRLAVYHEPTHDRVAPSLAN